MKKSRFFSAIISMALIISTTSAAYAGNRTITVERGGINIVIEDKLIEPKDVNGTIVEPFVYEGTTYLPVRAVAQAFGLTIEWHESLHVISLEKYDGVKGESSSSEDGSDDSQMLAPQVVKKTASLQEITVTTDEIFLMLNEEEVELKDANGNPVDILLSDGTNYLPVRAIANALKMDVLWEEETGTIYLTNDEETSTATAEDSSTEDSSSSGSNSDSDSE